MSPPDDGDREPSDDPSPGSATGSDTSDPDGRSPPESGTSDPDGRSPPESDGQSPSGFDSDDSSVGVESDRRDDAGERPGRTDSGTGDGTTGSSRDRPVDLEGNPGGKARSGGGTNWRVLVYDVVNSAVAVLLVGALLFAVSGVWPPMVAVESPSMNPQLQTGDLVFVMEETRFPGDGEQGETGVVTARVGRTTDADYRKFQRQGDVIVYKPDGDGDTTPIIHRAMFWVEDGENWYDKADRQAVGRYDRCGESTDEAMPNCPAPHAGFVTKGDANSRYDQVDGLSGPVRPEWVVGTAEVRIPLLGCIRLGSERCSIGTTTLVGATAPGGNTGVAATNATVSASNATAP